MVHGLPKQGLCHSELGSRARRPLRRLLDAVALPHATARGGLAAACLHAESAAPFRL